MTRYKTTKILKKKLFFVTKKKTLFKSLKKLTFCLQALFSPDARNPPKGPIKLLNKLTKNPWNKNG